MAGIGCSFCAYQFDAALLARDVAARLRREREREADDELAEHRRQMAAG